MAILAIVLALPNVRESKVEKAEAQYDVPGAITATLGMLSIVYGVSEASTKGWSNQSTLTFIGIGLALLIGFLALEMKVAHPLLPLRLFTRVRSGAYLAGFLSASGIFGMFLFMTFYFQIVHGYSAIRSGFSFLPFSLCVILSAGLSSRFIPKVGPRIMATGGLVVASAGLLYLSTITPGSSYFTHVMPALMIMSLGLGQVFVSQSTTALHATPFHDIGAASAMLNVGSQVGGSFGTALQNTLAVSATTTLLASHVPYPTLAQTHDAMVHGYATAFRFGSLVILVSAVVFYLMVNLDRHSLGHTENAAGVH
jgi:hypothetical protein